MPTSEDNPLAAHGATPGELRARIEAEREGDPFLVFRDGHGAQRLVTLGAQRARICIGRSPGNDVALEWDTEVSRLHAELERLGDEWTLADDGLSRNGSFLNGRRVTSRSRLRDGDVLRVGRTTLAYRVPEAPDSRPTRPAGSDGPALPELTAAQRRVLVALCRPYAAGELATPATNQQIADELFLSVDAVKAQLRALFQRFGVDGLPQNQKRSVLAMRAMSAGYVSARELSR
ncbi:MAG TPA: FHA domain-containing protein [Solirubrobacteraceae bacterium]|nr:FHA domain-containing protein [Solirubrobacteraceae bacterium]